MISMRQKLLCFCLFLSTILALFCSFSCAVRKKVPLEDLKSSYTAQVLIRIGEVEAEGTVCAEGEDSGRERSILLELEKPSSLTGLSLLLSPGGVTLSEPQLAPISLPIIQSSSFGALYRMLSAEGSVNSISSARGADVGLPEYDRITRVSTDSAIIYIDPEDSTPIKAECSSSGYSIQIFFYSFQPIEDGQPLQLTLA